MPTIVLLAAALTMVGNPAAAQTSTAGSALGSQAASIANPFGNINGHPIGNAAAASNSAASSRSNSNSRSAAAASSGQSSSTTRVVINNAAGAATSGAADGSTSGSSQTIRSTPEIIAPSIVGGNPCSIGASAGVALPGFGILGGGTWEAKGCERRQLAALLYNMGHDLPAAKGGSLQQAAVEVLCANNEVRAALSRAGKPCIADRAAASPVVSTVPTESATAPSERATTGMTRQATQIPAWCYTASPEELRMHPACAAKS